MLSHENMRMPDHGKYYSVNEANVEKFPAEYQDYLGRLRSGALGREYSSRYIGSLVADFHRTLLKGGIFLYPPTEPMPPASCGSSTKPIRSPSSPSRPAAPPPTASAAYSTFSPRAFISARPS